MKKLKRNPKILHLAKETVAVLTSGSALLDTQSDLAPDRHSGLEACAQTSIESAGTTG